MPDRFACTTPLLGGEDRKIVRDEVVDLISRCLPFVSIVASEGDASDKFGVQCVALNADLTVSNLFASRDLRGISPCAPVADCIPTTLVVGFTDEVLSVNRHRHPMSSPVIRFRIDFSATCAVAPAKIDLLEAIRNSGSLSRGARHLGMSYRRARMLIDSFKGAFREPVTRAIRGGPGGGGVVRTKFGAELVDRYRDLEREFGTLATRRLQMFTSSVASQRRPKSPSVSRTCHGRISREVSPIHARQVRGLVWGTIHFNRTACGTLGTVHTTPPLP
jgi:molybdate transport system regulatory protein